MQMLPHPQLDYTLVHASKLLWSTFRNSWRLRRIAQYRCVTLWLRSRQPYPCACRGDAQVPPRYSHWCIWRLTKRSYHQSLSRIQEAQALSASWELQQRHERPLASTDLISSYYYGLFWSMCYYHYLKQATPLWSCLYPHMTNQTRYSFGFGSMCIHLIT